jgi:hypothetical protein
MPMRLTFLSTSLSLLLAAAVVAALSPAAPSDVPPLKIDAEILQQRYCPSGDKTTYSIKFTVRTRLTNQSDHKIILSKRFGGGVMFHGAVASDAKNLASGNYEYNSNLSIWDGTVVYLQPETPERFNSPDSTFAILAPGESIRNAGYYWADSAGALPGSTPNHGTLQPGDHVLSVKLYPWSHKPDPIEINKKWEPIGELIYYPFKTGPIPFHLPPDPKLEKNCNSGLDINEP